MIWPRHALSSPLLARQFLDALPQCDEPLLEIDGYPEYATTIKDLDPESQRKVKELARKIVASQGTGMPIVSFLVRGHADVALRQPQANRAQFEQEVSEKRADAARNVILTEIMAQPGGQRVASTLMFTSKGFGSRFRKVMPTAIHPLLTEAEMRKNRRIEIFTAECPVKPPTPQPQPVPPPTPVRQEGTRWRIQIKSGIVTTANIVIGEQTGVLTTLVVEITDLDRKEKARFAVRATGFALPSVTFPAVPVPIQTNQVTEGKPTDFTTVKGVRVADFAGSVSIAQDPGAAVSVLSTGGNFNFSFDALDNRAAFTRPSVVSVAAGTGPFSLPQAAGGFVSTGSMSMSGAVTPAQ